VSAAADKVTVRVLLLLSLSVALPLSVAVPARAAEVTRVVSALDDDNRFDFNLSLSWLHEAKSTFVKRESQSELAPRTELIKDMTFNQRRDTLNLRADFGILWDVGLHIQAPLVLGDTRTLNFDQSEGSGCLYPGDAGGRPTCVNEQNSTILRDGILPGYQMSTYGLDADHNRMFSRPQTAVFRGPVRHGLENLGLGINWAVFNQARDDTKPTWQLGFDTKLDLFHDMRFDPAKPTDNTDVGLGYHQFIWSTVISKRFRHFDPYFGAWYMLPVRTNGSIYQKYPTGSQDTVNPQQVGGVHFGFEQIAWENPRGDQRVTVEFRGHAEEHFFGRSASELWEPLSGRSDCRADVGKCRPGLDEDLDGDGKPDPYPGVTETQAYGTFGANVGLNVQVGKYVRFRAVGGLALDMPHFITFAATGSDLNGDGRVDSNDAGDPITGRRGEANPVYRELIDIPGRRFKVEGTQIWSGLVEGAIMF
jgi:hypothetical protein